jgi:glycosyltransferase involved in cell wall biosynthesis
MKVLLMAERFAPDFRGGGEIVSLETARLARKRGIDLTVLTTGNPAVAAYEGIPTHRLGGNRYTMNLASGAAVRLARQADLIHAFSFHACLPALRAALANGIPVVCTFTALFGSAWRRMKPFGAGRLWERWERHLLEQPYDRHHFLTEESGDLAAAISPKRRRSVVITPGIDADAYAAVRPKENVILFAGKLEARKGIHDLLAAAVSLPHVKFRFVGFGPAEREVRRVRPANVELVAFERGEPLREHFRNASVFCLPSYAETFGLAVLEAMAAGCAVISSAPLGFEGARIRAGHREELVESIRALWSDAARREAAGRLNAQAARQFTWSRYGDAIAQLYEEVLQSASLPEEVREIR